MKFHAVDYVSLVFGAFFVIVAGFFLSTGFNAFEFDVRWIGPALLVVVGLAFLLPSRKKAIETTPSSLPDLDVEEAKKELFPSPLD